jgi:hypothetical protein
MRRTLLVLLILTCSSQSVGEMQSQQSLSDAWSAWRQGNVETAEEIAAKHVQADEGRHLLAFCAHARGSYTKAVEHYRAIDQSYRELDQLDEAMLHTLLHLHRYDEAVKFAEDRSMDKVVRAAASARAAKPLRANLENLTEIPFADHPLTPYFPAFAATVNGEQAIVHLDTGGTWLIMGPNRAAKLGIKLVKAGKGLHGSRKVKLQMGMAGSFTLGDAVLENVPVVGMPTLVGQQDFIIFGTNVLQQFHSILDYPNRKLLLCRRGDGKLIMDQMEIHKGELTELPFYMWGDHYMFARGGFGENRNLNFFVDSGLVALDPSSGELRQACFMATPEQYQEWGVEEEKTAKEFFECELPISLGALEQTNQYFRTTPKSVAGDFGGIQIDGLISHAFLKEYVWTLDFDRMRYVFSEQGK